MSSIQTKLESLQPYIHSIRFLQGLPVIDMILADGWTVLEDPNITRVKGEEGLNYHMLFSDKPGIDLDALLLHVEKIVKTNLDREKKHDLLRSKVNELKEIFKKNSLTKLQGLKFSFGEEDLMPSISDIDDDLDIDEKPPIQQSIIKRPLLVAESEEPEEEDVVVVVDDYKASQVQQTSQPITYLDENKQPIALTEDEIELIEEEKRAERNRQIMANKKQTSPVKPNAKKVELPPRRKIEMAVNDRDYETDCDCGPNDACEKCIDKKDY